MLTIDFKTARRNFFDADAVIARLSKAERRVLGKFGAFVRRAARQSIRRRKGSAPSGRPPYSHAKGNASLKTILFAYDPAEHAVIIGPAGFRKPGSVPKVTELGGRGIVVSRRKRGAPVVRSVNFDPHPFMGPALKKESPKLPAMWRDAI